MKYRLKGFNLKIKGRKKAVLLLVLLFIGCTLLFLIIVNISIPTTYNVTVKTERLQYQTIDENNSRIPLNDVQGYNYDGDDLGIMNGSFHISSNAHVLIERIAEGPLFIQITGKGKMSAGSIYSEQGHIYKEADNFIEFIIPKPSDRSKNGVTTIIPISGKVVLGRVINYESYNTSTAIVRSGTVKMIGKSLIGNHFFESGTFNLNIGDQFIMEEENTKAYGFIVVNEDSAMTAAYRMVGSKGKIITPGPVDLNSGYEISTSLISRFLYDNFFQGISWSFASLILLGTLLTFLIDLETVFGNRKK